MQLESVRDMDHRGHTYFWTDKLGKIISPYFDTEDQAQEWLRQQLVDTPPE
jgi:hypothetical protein